MHRAFLLFSVLSVANIENIPAPQLFHSPPPRHLHCPDAPVSKDAINTILEQVGTVRFE